MKLVLAARGVAQSRRAADNKTTTLLPCFWESKCARRRDFQTTEWARKFVQSVVRYVYDIHTIGVKQSSHRCTMEQKALGTHHTHSPHLLVSLVMWLNTDSTMVAGADSIFGAGFMPDSLPFSPRTGNRFELAVVDTTRTATYRLDDPDSDDYIGTLSGDVTQLNAASWE